MKRLIFSILGFVIVGCHLVYAYAYKDIIPRGQVIDTIKCIDNRQQSYALYLPSYYSTDSIYPIIYIFEPAARGSFPVQKYHKLAEEFGFILICSNNSGNGPQAPIDLAYQAVFNDSKVRFMEDTSRLYTMGFSGGARVAARIAIRDKNIKGVIACGAGFPGEYTPVAGMNFTFVGLVGDLDMNYIEVKNLENELEKKNIPHQMIYYHDEHRWPPESVMKKAFLNLQFDAMRRSLINVDINLINNYKIQMIHEIDSVSEVEKKYAIYKELSNNLFSLIDTDDIQERINILEESHLLKQHFSEEEKYLKAELRLSESINKAFYDKENYSIQWWKGETAKLNKSINDSDDVRQIFIAKRMINKIFSAAIEFYWLNNQNIDFNESLRIFKLASLAKPESPYPDYYLASIYAKNNKQKAALKHLQKSANKGFSNIDYLQTDKSFDNLRTNIKYLEILKQINTE
ncbi:MAG: hypothetical protein P1P88_18320 [Bacteroidales bacterium]|nr:hypothetical protein [Bacteroidales bacterium]